GNRLTAVFVVLSRVASLIERLNICNFHGSIEPFSLALFFHKSLDTTHNSLSICKILKSRSFTITNSVFIIMYKTVHCNE
ncbi:MAG: hypothetical protein IJN92_03535, partial [Lachnospiraceae bacterium]|nr:hypothetical protein [Lachnospiraceae bacterium]